MSTPSSILARELPGTEELGRLQSQGHKESDITEQLSTLCIAITRHIIEYIFVVQNLTLKLAV